MAFCKNCGNELREGAKFCPKCGNPINHEIQTKEDGNGNKWVRYGVIAIVLIAACYFIGTLGNSKSEETTSNQQTEQASDDNKALEAERRKENQMRIEAQRKEAEAQRKETEAQRKEAEELRKEQEFKNKIMQHTAQIQEVMTAINNKYNSFLQTGNSGAMNEIIGVHAMGDIANLKSRGDAIFDKMINLARQNNYRDILNAIKQEKKDFDDQAYQMTSNIRKFIYNY